MPLLRVYAENLILLFVKFRLRQRCITFGLTGAPPNSRGFAAAELSGVRLNPLLGGGEGR